MDDLPLPGELTDTIDKLREVTGLEPAVTTTAPRRWRIDVDSDRVHMDVDFRAARRDRIVWLRSTLSVDGQPRKIASSIEHLGRIFRDPDNECPDIAQADELLPQVDPNTAPAVVRHVYASLARAVGDAARVGNLGDKWVVSFSGPDRELQLRFLRDKRKVGQARQFIQLIVGGRDLSEQVAGRLDEALALLTAPRTGPAVAATEGETAGGEGFGSVGVRRHSVMRN
jgi:hypothetical protein